jgi:hypothetical protein
MELDGGSVAWNVGARWRNPASASDCALEQMERYAKLVSIYVLHVCHHTKCLLFSKH